jgi:phosphoheptose isomerase
MHFSTTSFDQFSDEYLTAFAAATRALDRQALARIMTTLDEAKARGAEVFVAGNGGSAAIANHFECDATKGTHTRGAALRTRSLAANTSILTALGNDLGYETVFEKQVEYFGRPGDVVVLVSSSGNSPNVVRAAETAKARGLVTVALVGFKGGALKSMCDVVLHVPVDNYGIVEDLHQAAVHLITQYLRARWA